ncbi:hypothetical protein EYM_05220 [Ignicoccus islandicus DSM 13165]|uniref:DUF2341 domain-containing protein n=1 Tax=Ignicoccus islandicus DSM 13165 TaxID=940295 RepID=A0A0U3FA71_9CREN|nr:hypothetical protein [Ignicoccus islandicus]ALU12569.1 hypothetical protein EYM_05220 [Ignicoccus islandicus DSM 13165]
MKLMKGGIENVITLTILVILLVSAIMILVSALARQTSLLQTQIEKASEEKLSIALATKIGGCASKVFDVENGEWAVIIKTNSTVPFCNYVRAVQIIGTLNGVKKSYLITLNQTTKAWESPQTLATYPSSCGTPISVPYSLDGSTTPQGTFSNVVLEVIGIPKEFKLQSVQILISDVGWRELQSCIVGIGGGVTYQVTQTTTIYSVGPVTIVASANFNPMKYLCPPPKTVVGDDNAYEIAVILNPQMNGTRNDVPTSYLVDLKSLIERAAPPSSPLKVNEDYVYIRNVTVLGLRSTPGLGPYSLTTTGPLPWSFTALNYTSDVPLYKSSGVLTIGFNATTPMTPTSLTQYSAVVCLYLGIKGQVPAEATGVLGDVNNDGYTDWKEIKIPGVSNDQYKCFTGTDFHYCYIPSIYGYYNRTLTDKYGITLSGLQEPVDSTLRVPKVIIKNPNAKSLFDYVVRIKLPTELVGKNLTVLDMNGGKLSFCYETSLGDCSTNAAEGDGYIWVRVPYIPAGDKAVLQLVEGKNGARNPLEVFPVYVSFRNATMDIDEYKYIWYFPGNAWTFVAAVFDDANGYTNFVNSDSDFTIVADVRWDAAPNPDVDDRVVYGTDEYSSRFIYNVYPIAYSYDPNTGNGWVLALYKGLPFINVYRNGNADIIETAPEALIPGIKYRIVAGVDLTNGKAYVSVFPLEEERGERPQITSLTNEPKRFEIPNQVGHNVIVISDADYATRSSFWSTSNYAYSFSGMIYNVTLFDDYLDSNVAVSCYLDYNETLCPKMVFYLNGSDSDGLYANLNGINLKARIFTLNADNRRFSVNEVTATPYPLGGEIDMTVYIGGDKTHPVKVVMYGTPMNNFYDPNAVIDLENVVKNLPSMFTGESFVMNTTALGLDTAWNVMLNMPAPESTKYEVVVGVNGGSYSDYNSLYGWNIIYPLIPAVVADDTAWLKWMFYEDPVDGYRISFVRNSPNYDAWRIYFHSFGTTVATKLSDPNKLYYTVLKYDMSRPSVTIKMYEGGPLGTIFYYSLSDLSQTNLAIYYEQLRPKYIKYIGMGYIYSNDALVSEDERIYYYMFMRPLAELEPSVEVEMPDLSSPYVDLPIVYYRDESFNVNGNNTEATITYDLLGNETDLSPYGYVYLSNANLGPFTELNDFTSNAVVAPLWSDRSYDFNVTYVKLGLSTPENWTAVVWYLGLGNVSVAINDYGDFAFDYHGEIALPNAYAIGLNNPATEETLLIIAKDGNGEYNGLLGSLTELSNVSIVGINKRNWYVLISGPYCIKC